MARAAMVLAMAGKPEFLSGGGEMGTLMRRHDWSASPLGSPQAWPQPLKTLAGVMLSANQPMFVAWGPERTLLYNDAYGAILAAKHPGALGRDFLEVWAEIRPDLVPIVEAAYAGQPVHMDDIKLVMERRGYPEETHFAFSYTPVRDERGNVAGFFCPCTETTGQVLAERRLAAETERQRRLFQQAPGFITALRGPDHVFEFVNDAYARLFGERDYVGKTARDVFPELAGQGFFELLDRVYTTGERFIAQHIPIRLQNSSGEEQEERFLDFIYEPVRVEDGRVTGIFCEGHDVTEVHRAQEALRESEERARRIVEGVKDHAVLVTDVAGTIVDWTPGAAAVFGWSAEEITGRNSEVLFTPEDRAAGVPAQELDTARENGFAPDQRWHVRRDGSCFYANGSVRPLHDAQGRVAGYIKIARDETERREFEARLRASEEFNRRILASSADCIKVLDLDARLEFMSEGGMCVMEVDDFGNVEGKCWPDFWQGEDHERALAAVEEAKRGGTGRFQGFARTFKGTPRWWDVIVSPISGPDGRPEKLLSISRDVTATKQAEEAVRELNATLEQQVAERTAERNLLATIVETTDIMVMAADLGYNILAINKANADEFERIYGVRPRAGDNMLKLLDGQPEHQEQVRTGWARVLGGEEVTFLEEFGDPTLDRPYYEIKFRTLKNADGELVGAYHFVTDVTERLRAEAQLVETQEALRQSQKMEAMGQLTGGVAHDFNNLLTPIVGSLDLLQRRRVGSEREQRMIGGALESAERAKTLVQRLLAFARRQPLQPVAVDLGGLVSGMAGLLGSTLGPAINVRVELPDDLPPAKADPNQLEMAILNLSVNARDAMPDGGTLTIAAARESVRAGHRSKLKQGHYVRLSVSDTGHGMDEATLARAVEPFFSTKGIGKGTGLGLSMVHGLAAQLGGALHITSEPGRGTTVELWLPISAAPLDADGQSAPTAVAVKTRGRALLVDDEELVRMSTADMLGDLGYEVMEAGSAEEAMRLLQDGAALDLLITDHLMPGLSGADLAREVRRLRPGMPVLIVSGYAEVEGIAPDLPRLTKPFRNADLAASLASMFGTASAT